MQNANKTRVLFVQGGGEGGYEADSKLAALLQKALGVNYELSYPRIVTDDSASDFGWLKQIGRKIDMAGDKAILVGHSLGASMLLKYLSENNVSKKVAGIFLLATPFWNGEEQWKQGLKLRGDFVAKLPGGSPIFFYHCRDDEEVPFNHLELYRQKLPEATFCAIESGGHQLGNSIDLVANDIKSLSPQIPIQQ